MTSAFTVPGGARRGADRAGRPRPGSSSWTRSPLPIWRFSESDRFNALIMGADLDWHDVSVLRSIGRYLRQVGVTFSQTYVAQALSSNVDIARLLVQLFRTRFDPRSGLDPKARGAAATELVDKIKRALDDVASLDHDRIMRLFLAVIQAVVRTNFYVRAAGDRTSNCCQEGSPSCPSLVRSSRSSSIPRGSRVSICVSGRWPGAASAGRIERRTFAPRCWAWSRRRW